MRIRSIADSPVPHLQIVSEWDEFINRAVIPLNPKRIVEIGSFYGATLWNFIQNCPELEKIVAIDLPIPMTDGRWSQMLWSRALWKHWSDRIVDMKGNSHLKETHTALKEELNGQQIDLLFIDGDHSSDGVRADYEMYKEFVRPGGLIAFHDCNVYPGIRSLTNELKEGNITYEISHPSGWGIFILIKE